MILPALALLVSATPLYAADSAPSETASSCSQYAGLLHRLAGCMRDSIDYTARYYFHHFGGLVADAIGAFATLAIIIYGVMLAWGLVEKVGRDTMVLLIKIAAVFYFVANSAFIFDTLTKAVDGAAYAVVSFTPPSSVTMDASGTTGAQTVCMNAMIDSMARVNEDKKAIAPWLGVDCLLDTVIGIKKVDAPGAKGVTPPVFDGTWFNPKFDNPDPAKTNPGVSRGLVFFFTSNMQTSVMGMVLAVAGLVFTFGLLMLVVRAFFIYMMGYIGLAFLTVISPLIIPLVMLQQTKQYFDKWVKLLFTFSMQPVLSLVFIIFMLTAIDLATISGSYSLVYRIAGDESRKTNFDLNQYLTVLRTPDGKPDPDQAKPADTSRPIISREDVAFLKVKAENKNAPSQSSTDQGGVTPGADNSSCVKRFIDKDPNGPLVKTCGTAYDISTRMNRVNWLLMAKARLPLVTMMDGSSPPDDAALQRQMSNEVLAALLFACLVVFVLNGLTKLIPTMLIDVLGDVGQTPNLFSTAGSAGSGFGGLGNKVSGFASSAKSMVTGRK